MALLEADLAIQTAKHGSRNFTDSGGRSMSFTESILVKRRCFDKHQSRENPKNGAIAYYSGIVLCNFLSEFFFCVLNKANRKQPLDGAFY